MSKIALVGCGRQMRNALIPHLAQIEGFEIEVCVDTDEVVAQTVQKISRANSYAHRIEDVDISAVDAAIIALPANANYQVTSYLLSQGVACFVEKPPANTTDEINTLLQLASAMEVYVQVGFNFRFAEAMATFYTHVAGHRTGPSNATFEFRSKHPSGPEWGIDDPVAAWLYHNGIHALDLLLWSVGDAERVHATIIRNCEEKFTLVAMIEHKNNSVSTAILGTLTDKFDLRADLYTSDSHRFCVPHLGEATMMIRNGKVAGDVIYRASNLDSGWGRTGYGPELQYFLDNYRKYKNGSPSLLDALRASQLCDAIMESLQARTISSLK